MPIYDVKPLFKPEVDAFLNSLSDEAKKKLWKVVNALRLSQELNGSSEFPLPLEKIKRNKASDEDAREGLSNLHERRIIEVTYRLKVKYSPDEYVTKTIVELPDISSYPGTRVRIDKDRFTYLEARLRRIQQPVSPFEELVRFEESFDEKNCIIASRALRLVAKEIDSIPSLKSTPEMGHFLKSCGVSPNYYEPWLRWKPFRADVREVYSAENILATMENPAKPLSKEDYEKHSRAMVLYRILLHYSCSPEQNQEILFRILESSIDPLLFDGVVSVADTFKMRINILLEHAGYFFDGRKVRKLGKKFTPKLPPLKAMSPEAKQRIQGQATAMKRIVARNEETERIANEVIKKMKNNEAEQAGNNPSGKVHLVEKNGVGFLQFHKNGKLYRLGGVETRCHKLIQSLCEPHFGVHKTMDAVFEAIRQSKDSQDQRLTDPALKRNRVIEIINNTIKELQKKDKVPGKLLYKRPGKEIWLEEK